MRRGASPPLCSPRPRWTTSWPSWGWGWPWTWRWPPVTPGSPWSGSPTPSASARWPARSSACRRGCCCAGPPTASRPWGCGPPPRRWSRPARRLGASFVVAILAAGVTTRAMAPTAAPLIRPHLAQLWAPAQVVLFGLIGLAVDLPSLTAVGLAAAAAVGLGQLGRAAGRCAGHAGLRPRRQAAAGLCAGLHPQGHDPGRLRRAAAGARAGQRRGAAGRRDPGRGADRPPRSLRPAPRNRRTATRRSAQLAQGDVLDFGPRHATPRYAMPLHNKETTPCPPAQPCAASRWPSR